MHEDGRVDCEHWLVDCRGMWRRLAEHHVFAQLFRPMSPVFSEMWLDDVEVVIMEEDGETLKGFNIMVEGGMGWTHTKENTFARATRHTTPRVRPSRRGT